MNRRYRKTIIAGNWKMNKTPTEARALAETLKTRVARCKWCEVVLCVPFTDIVSLTRATKDCRISVGAQNLHQEESGAYTGEVSGKMLKDAGVKYVIIGHSERRQYAGESNELVARKVKAALTAGLRAIVCVGETLKERDMGVTNEVVALQVRSAFDSIPTTDELKKIVFAYEPVWAIGTGRNATPEQAAEVCTYIRTLIRKKYGARAARAVTIQYGGSMNADNARELLAQLDVDGGLIGGASLDPDSFAAIVQAANQ
ncbi:MAG: triose-phosphate isomerase [Oscillospiraceae bacterium]|nr:triose-phosphate isomerase [Oscillospiraceae bacterium]